MSFASMNGITQARAAVGGGMQGTNRTPTHPAQVTGASGPYARPPPQAGPGAAAFAQTHTAAPAGMMGSQGHPIGGSQLQNNQARMQWTAATDGSGVAPGVQGPNLPPPPQGAPFDPNDPNNAALAGYMAR